MADVPAGTGGSLGRAAAFGAVAGLAGAIATVVLGGALGISSGLLIVAGATGWAVAAAVASGGGGAARPAARIGLAVGITLGAVVVGQLGLWLYARTEGGVLTLPDYLAQTFGLLVPAQAAVAVAIAWLTAR